MGCSGSAAGNLPFALKLLARLMRTGIMETIKKRTLNLISIMFVVVLAGVLTGCATIDGAGKDIEKLGDEIQEAAN